MIHLAESNPGAIRFIIALKDADDTTASIIMDKVLVCKIKGVDLYILWNDLGDRNLERVANICLEVPNNVLIDACSRQDYSGEELIQPYLKE